MSKKEGTTSPSGGASAAGTCAVCEEPAAGTFFGAMVCLPCKSFFIRCSKEGGPRLGCTWSNQCDVTKANRLRCQLCRYKKCQAVGMVRKEKPEVVVPVGNQNLCAVCGDIANGVHFGQPACEGCKKFFRKAMKEHHTYECLNEKTCVINPRTRNNCRFCRYQKALTLGMSKDAAKMGRPRKHDKKEPTTRTVKKEPESASKVTVKNESPSLDLKASKSYHAIDDASNCSLKDHHVDVKPRHISLQMQSHTPALNTSTETAFSSSCVPHKENGTSLPVHARVLAKDQNHDKMSLYDSHLPFDLRMNREGNDSPVVVNGTNKTIHKTVLEPNNFFSQFGQSDHMKNSNNAHFPSSSENINCASSNKINSNKSEYNAPFDDYSRKRSSSTSVVQPSLKLPKSNASSKNADAIRYLLLDDNAVCDKNLLQSEPKISDTFVHMSENAQEISSSFGVGQNLHCVAHIKDDLNANLSTNISDHLRTDESNLTTTSTPFTRANITSFKDVLSLTARNSSCPSNQHNEHHSDTQADISLTISASGSQIPKTSTTYQDNTEVYISDSSHTPPIHANITGSECKTKDLDDLNTMDSETKQFVNTHSFDNFNNDSNISVDVSTVIDWKGQDLNEDVESTLSNFADESSSTKKIGHDSEANCFSIQNDHFVFNLISRYTNDEWFKLEKYGLFSEAKDTTYEDLMAKLGLDQYLKLSRYVLQCSSSSKDNSACGESDDSHESLKALENSSDYVGGHLCQNWPKSLTNEIASSSNYTFKEFDISHWKKMTYSNIKPLIPLQTRLIEMIRNRYQIMLNYTDEDLNPLFQNYESSKAEYWPENKEETVPFWNHLKDRIIRNTHGIIAFLQSLPGVSRISSNDQMQLAKVGGTNIIYLMSALDRYDPKLGNMKFFWNWKYSQKSPVSEFRKDIIAIGEVLYHFGLDDVEKAVLIATAAISPDWNCLENREVVGSIQNVYMETLKSYMKKRGRNEMFFVKMIALVLKTRELSMWTAQMLQKLTFQVRDQELSYIFALDK